MIPVHSADWTDDDIHAYLALCAGVGITDLSVPFTVWSHESDNSATAHDRDGDASGVFQLMPATAKAIGYNTILDPHLAAFRALSLSEQLAWAAKYYRSHAGHIGNVGQFYCSTFLPILTEHATTGSYLLCGAEGQGPLRVADSKAAYEENKGFDIEHRGSIIVQDLVDAAYRASNSKTTELTWRANELTPTAP